MKKMLRVTLPGVLLILAMALGAWSAPQVNAGSKGQATPKPTQSSGNSGSNQSGSSSNQSSSQKSGSKAQYSSEQSSEKGFTGVPTSLDPAWLVQYANGFTKSGSIKMSGSFSNVSGLQQRVTAVSAFKFNMTSFNSSISSFSSSEFDKQFVEDSLTSNSAELWTMLHSVKYVKDADLRNALLMMIQMHAQDEQTILQIAPKFGIDVSSVDFTNASVYPETPDYDLGMRTENMTKKYFDHVAEQTSGASYDDVVLHVLDSMHTEDVQGELAAERLVQSADLKAFAKHSADVTELHIEMLDMVTEHSSLHFDEVPSPDFSAGYMSPFQITVNGQSSQGKSGSNQSGNSSNNSSSNQSGSSSNKSGSGSSSSSSSSGSH